MPRTIDEGFRDFLPKLTPSSTESQATQSHRTSIEACLKANFGLNRFTRIGSYGNGTSIYGYSDVDYLACIPTNQLTQTSNASLQKICNALAARFPNTGVGVRCPAVSVPFGTTAAERTEVVPADYIKESDGFSVYEIADCANGWMQVSPDAHNAYVREVDQKLGCKVKPLIRFIKAWKYFRDVPLSSFYLELRVAKYASTETCIVYDIDVRNVLKSLYDSELARIQDPMGVSGYISPCSSDARYKDAMSKLGTALGRAEKAREAAAAERISDAFDWWRLLYGEKFPTYYRG